MTRCFSPYLRVALACNTNTADRTRHRRCGSSCCLRRYYMPCKENSMISDLSLCEAIQLLFVDMIFHRDFFITKPGYRSNYSEKTRARPQIVIILSHRISLILHRIISNMHDCSPPMCLLASERCE